jgi:hypothetical protein
MVNWQFAMISARKASYWEEIELARINEKINSKRRYLLIFFDHGSRKKLFEIVI